MSEPIGNLIHAQVDPGDFDRIKERILDRVNMVDTGHSTPCWVSNRAHNGSGYTKMSYGQHTIWYVHRLAYIVFVGPIPNGLHIDHLCRVRACCNPDHLEPVTPRENVLRGESIFAKEALVTHCPAGHEYVEQNTYRRPDGSHKRDCLNCRRKRRRKTPRPSRSKAAVAARLATKGTK